MKTLGVTGGIGSGKSAVCDILADLGARIFVADDEAKRIMEQHPEVRADIREAFGAKSYDEEGRLNRAHLARHVFGREEHVQQINAIVHPRVFEAFERAKAKARDENVDLLVHEAALIFEAGGEEHLDAVLVVDAPEELRIRRVVERDDVRPAQVRARMAHQLPPHELRRRADYVIENVGSLDDLRMQVQRVYRDMMGKGD